MEQVGIIAALCTAVGSLVSAVLYLFRDNGRLTAELGKCQREHAGTRAELVSLNALVESYKWVGNPNVNAVVVVNMSTGLIVEWNPGATILLHWTEREMLGKPVTRIMPDRYRQQHIDAVTRMRSADATPKGGPIRGYALTKDGVEVPVEIRLSGWRDGGMAMVAAEISRRPDSAETRVEGGKDDGDSGGYGFGKSAPR